MKIITETDRLILREWEPGDEKYLKQFLQDIDVMYAYDHAFSDEEVKEWLDWNLQSYRDNGYGLWAIELKKTGEIVGECGLTNQTVDDVVYQEIGYHLLKKAWHQGFAIEAAQAVKTYAFEKLQAQAVVSIVRDTNLASMNVAIRNGMIIKKRFMKQDKAHYLFRVEK